MIRGSARLVLVKIACAFSFASRSERSMAHSLRLADSSILGEIVKNGICKRLSNWWRVAELDPKMRRGLCSIVLNFLLSFYIIATKLKR